MGSHYKSFKICPGIHSMICCPKKVLVWPAPQMLLSSCFMLRFDEEFIDKLALIISDQITLLYAPFSAHEVNNTQRDPSTAWWNEATKEWQLTTFDGKVY